MNIENLLFPTEEFITQYNTYLERGKIFLSQKNICILGLTRNTSQIINKNIRSIAELGMSAKNYKIILFENDSTDNTVSIINELCKSNSNIELISEKYNFPQFGPIQSIERTTKLAFYRNQLKKYAYEKYHNYDFTIVMDTDFQNFSINGVYNSFGWMENNEHIGAVCGNSFEYKPIFSASEHPSLWNYDCWAYRGSWWNNLQIHNVPSIRYNPMLWFGLQVLPVGSHPLRINSGFGGMCIYKNEFYSLADYSGEDCEHVMLHYHLKQSEPRFNLFLNPSQIMLL
jgi:hypothetical protein